ncbi:hypothetical protein FA13DRAFT_586904 [Coprinellus micaceus]|uniref:Uncharacterized protein n=1 Tax=Coprinellus micaceus TaxID=71717 RepID=A0A4Y7SAT9_COPMI|nr:hypothetical protein FA13DRAFT_586904 [Coprinellus micaceus]
MSKEKDELAPEGRNTEGRLNPRTEKKKRRRERIEGISASCAGYIALLCCPAFPISSRQCVEVCEDSWLRNTWQRRFSFVDWLVQSQADACLARRNPFRDRSGISL